MNTSIQSGQSKTASRSLGQLLREHPLFSFFFLSYAFSWIISLPYVLSIWGVMPGNYMLGLIFKQWVGPALAGIVMTLLIEGKAGLRTFRRRWWQWRAGWQWYLFILLGVPGLILLGIVIQPGALAHFQGLPPHLLVNYLVYFVIVFFGVGLPEEIGWRGFALPRMQPRYGPLRATLLLGVLWAGWHLLFFLMPDHGGGPGTDPAALLKNFSIFFVMVMAMSIVFTWVFNHTRGSVFIASLVHTAIDVPQLVWVPLFLQVGTSNSTSGETGLDLALLVTFGVLALLIVILTRGHLGYQPGEGSR
ncbi:MAG: CPBP family intramembrane glutamic endopeptidase [Syntrophothermus sp.]